MPPTRRTRLAAVARWGCTVACVVLLVAWATSANWLVGVHYRAGAHESAVFVGVGQAGVQTGDSVSQSFTTPKEPDGFGVDWYGPPLEFQWAFRVEHIVLMKVDVWVVAMPLGLIAFALAVPSAFLWYRHRRRGHGPGRCAKCGYELAGLTAGAACPECGQG